MSSRRRNVQTRDIDGTSAWIANQQLLFALQKSRKTYKMENAARSVEQDPSLQCAESTEVRPPKSPPVPTDKRGSRKRRKYEKCSEAKLQAHNADENSKQTDVGLQHEGLVEDPPEASKTCSAGANESWRVNISPVGNGGSEKAEPVCALCFLVLFTLVQVAECCPVEEAELEPCSSPQALRESDRPCTVIDELADAVHKVEGSTKKKPIRRSSSRRSGKKKRKKDIVRAHFGIREPGKLAEALQLAVEDEVHLVIDDEHEDPVKERRKNAVAYPSRSDPDAVEVDAADLECLCETQYLNDTVIDFYIKHLEVIRSSASRSRYHVFSSFFFTKLAEAVCIEDQMFKLRKWTRGVNIFEKTYLIMPVHHKLHWSLAVVCFLEPPGSDSYGRCCLLHLDSMKTGHDSNVVYEVLRRYLSAEWKLHHNGHIGAASSKNIHVRKVKVPQQENGYDCGLFVLHFLEQFVENAPASFDLEVVKDMGNWFKATDASELRVIIRQLIEKVFKAEDRAVANRKLETRRPGEAQETEVLIVDEASEKSPDVAAQEPLQEKAPMRVYSRMSKKVRR